MIDPWAPLSMNRRVPDEGRKHLFPSYYYWSILTHSTFHFDSPRLHGHPSRYFSDSKGKDPPSNRRTRESIVVELRDSLDDFLVRGVYKVGWVPDKTMS